MKQAFAPRRAAGVGLVGIGVLAGLLAGVQIASAPRQAKPTATPSAPPGLLATATHTPPPAPDPHLPTLTPTVAAASAFTVPLGSEQLGYGWDWPPGLYGFAVAYEETKDARKHARTASPLQALGPGLALHGEDSRKRHATASPRAHAT